MAKLDLTQYGITGSKVIAHNPSYEFLFEEETKAGLTFVETSQTSLCLFLKKELIRRIVSNHGRTGDAILCQI